MAGGMHKLSGISGSPELCIRTSVGRPHEKVKGSMHHTQLQWHHVYMQPNHVQGPALQVGLGATYTQQADTPA